MSSMTRYPLILAALAGAMALGACGSAKDNNGGVAGAKGQDKAFEGALKFSKCMREHGIDMPDPKRVGNGGISISGPAGGPGKARLKRGVPDPKMKTAQAACQKYMDIGGGGPPMDPAQQARLQDAFFAYARCMRGKGVNMPDPKVSSHGVEMQMQGGPGTVGNGAGPGPGGPGPESPVFKAADTACHHFLAQVERQGGAVKEMGGGPSQSVSK
jgi:hypothetical protein